MSSCMTRCCSTCKSRSAIPASSASRTPPAWRSARPCRPSRPRTPSESPRTATPSTLSCQAAAARRSTPITEDHGEETVTSTREGIGEWVLLSYRLPREPSTPRIAVWRKLRRLGVAQISDGLVALPAGARTREQLEWVSEEVIDARGTAAIWLARPATRAQEDQLAQAMAAARGAEYQALITAADQAAASLAADPPARAAAVRRLRNELRAIQRRDYFPPAERDHAHAALQALAASREAPPSQPPSASGSRPGAGARQPDGPRSRHEVGDPRGHPHRPGGLRLADPPPRRRPGRIHLRLRPSRNPRRRHRIRHRRRGTLPSRVRLQLPANPAPLRPGRSR